MREDGRLYDELRKIHIETDYTNYAEGSVYIAFGATRLLCNVSVEERVPPFLRGTGGGWVTAEYAMLPRATHTRMMRESVKGRASGRTMEIQRLIGRALRSIMDLKTLGERTLWIDCDVLQADGGTRAVAITGAFVAVANALATLLKKKAIKKIPLQDFIAAASVGLKNGQPYLDLTCAEDTTVSVDMNVVMTGGGKYVEVQGTGEHHPFDTDELHALLAYAKLGVDQLITKQKEVLGPELTELISG
ncbi:MAG: ribonuclease [Bacillota bacterium]